MQNKLYVIIEVPVLEKTIDAYIPITKRVGTVKKILIEMVSKVSDNTFINDNCKNLYDKVSGEVIDDASFVKNSGIKNGSRLLLY